MKVKLSALCKNERICFAFELMKINFLNKIYARRESPFHNKIQWNSEIGSFSNDDGDGNKNVVKAKGLMSKTTTLHVHYTFSYISLPSLHDWAVKFPDGTFCGRRKHTTTNFSFFF